MTVRRRMTAVAAMTAAGLAYGAGPALAYIGPGAGLSLLGALWGVAAAVLAALLFLLLWPLRRLLRRRSAAPRPRTTQEGAPPLAAGRTASPEGAAQKQHR
jgi:membrane protein implicated in regulation of membrane protease activity